MTWPQLIGHVHQDGGTYITEFGCQNSFLKHYTIENPTLMHKAAHGDTIEGHRVFPFSPVAW